MNILPGCLLHGGSDESIVPKGAMGKWESDFGWKGQHHLQFVGLHRSRRSIPLHIDVAKRIIEGGGYAQIGIWGTPEDLASVPTDWRDPSGKLVYPKHPPSDFAEWARRYVQIVRAFTKAIDPKKLYFNIWLEPNRWWWRSSDRTFYAFYGVVQDAIRTSKLKGHFGGCQITDLGDYQIKAQHYTATPALLWTERWLRRAQKHGWQIDFIDLFMYGNGNVDEVVGRISGIEDLMVELDFTAEVVFNCLSRGYLDDADYTMRLAKSLMETGVDRAGFDFLEEVGENTPNGLLKYKTLEETARYQVARKIIQWYDRER